MNGLMTKATEALGKVRFTAQKHSPEILLVTGIVGVVGGVVLACRATLKANEVLEEHKKNMDSIHEAAEIDQAYAASVAKRDTTLQYVKTTGKFAALYAPAAIVLVLSIGCFCKSHNILNTRNIGLTAAYTAADKAFNEYRARVVDKYGEKVDQELRYGLKEETVEETITDEKGKEKTVKSKQTIADGLPNMYARYICKGNNIYEESDDFMFNLIECLSVSFTNEMRKKGFITLNEVYKQLDIPECNDGMVCGWRYNKNRPDYQNQVIIEVKPVKIINAYGKREKAYLLDFRVDGCIYQEEAEDEGVRFLGKRKA